MTLRQRLLDARARLISAGVDQNEAVLDTNLLARHVLGWTRSQLLLRQEDPPPEGFEEAFSGLIERRARREPMLQELKQRIRDVRQGPDGLLYVLTAEDDGALLRIEPME